MIEIASIVVLTLGIGAYFIFYRTKRDDSEDIYLWVGPGKDPFKK